MFEPRFCPIRSTLMRRTPPPLAPPHRLRTSDCRPSKRESRRADRRTAGRRVRHTAAQPT
eukprot:24519-Prymnesium_polylepis.2